jgi:hypothetical protein
MEIEPIYFLTPGTDVLVKFKNDDEEYQYFPGRVKHINYFGKDERGGYINCYITYEDGEEVSESFLYNQDFENPDSDDGWKFASNVSLLIKYMVESHQEIKELRDLFLSENPPSVDNDDSAFDSEDDESDTCPSYQEKPSTLLTFSKLVLNLSVSTFLGLWSYKLAKDMNIV